MQGYRRLKVWQKAHRTTLEVYRVTRSLPAKERFGLISQMERAAVSVAANIVEGSARGSDREAARFFRYSLGSAAELEYLLLLATDLGYGVEQDLPAVSDAVVEVKRMLARFVARLTTSIKC
ncbi:MAG: four helix bundle protein [Gemmatimonadales bacterium]